MTAVLTIALITSVAIYFGTYKLVRKWRLLAAVAAFVLLGVAPLAYVLFVGEH